MTYDPPPLFTPPNLWRTVSLHGQPPPNTLIDFVWGNGTSTTMGRLTGAEPAYSEHIKWRLSDLPPLDAVQPAPTPERPEPKNEWKAGDWFVTDLNDTPRQVTKVITTGPRFNGLLPEDRRPWLEYGDEMICASWIAQRVPAPEPPVIPIGGWFDPGDGRTLQRVEVGSGIPELVWYMSAGGFPIPVHVSHCSPLTEREAMERLYPVGTWLQEVVGGPKWEVIAYHDDDADLPVLIRRDHGTLQGYTTSIDYAFLRRCTVLPGPPLPAPWRPLDELPEDGEVRVMAWLADGRREVIGVAAIRMRPGVFRAWADLDDVAPIPAHLRSTP